MPSASQDPPSQNVWQRNSDIVVTIDPVSNRQEMFTPPILMVTFGQGPTKFGVGLGGSFPLEPVMPPSEMWLSITEGASFPTAGTERAG